MTTQVFSVDGRGLCPEFDHGEETILAGVGEKVESPVVLGRRVAPLRIRKYEMEWENATEGQVYLATALFDAGGKTGIMNMIPVDEDEIIEVRFATDLDIERTGPWTWRMRFTLEEVPGCLV